MSKKRTNEIYRCWKCGQFLDESNCRPCADSQSGLAFMCISCESEMFNRLAKTEGRFIALFHTCAALDIPVKPIVLDGIDFDSVDEPFMTYINALSESGQDIKRGKVLGFSDGVTSLSNLFGNDLSHKDFAERIRREKEKIAKQVGTEEQRERWGTEMLYRSPNLKIPALVMTQNVYDELDRIYENRAQELKGQTITPQIEFTLQEVAKNTVIYSYQRRYGERDADKTWKTIDTMLASESLRKKDEKPIANFTPDAWIDAFEKAGIMKDGQFLPMNEIEQEMIKIMKGNGYPQTLDAAYQFEMNIIKNAARNGDQPIPFELPSDMKIDDSLDEFATEETEEEKTARNYSNLAPVRFENGEE